MTKPEQRTNQRLRIHTTIPDDPRFDQLRTVLRASITKGRSSPGSRMLAELALIGWQVTQGHYGIPIASRKESQ